MLAIYLVGILHVGAGLREETNDSFRPCRRRKHLDTLQIVRALQKIGRYAFSFVREPFAFEHDCVEQVLNTFISEIDVHLLKPINVHVFEPEDVQNTNAVRLRGAIRAHASTKISVNRGDDEIKHSGVDNFHHGISGCVRLLHASVPLDDVVLRFQEGVRHVVRQRIFADTEQCASIRQELALFNFARRLVSLDLNVSQQQHGGN
mmetsp:Transcript_20367/g.54458  ORF Transcript_20367/g.54458 Transcript_20367/m.54458 type:complete len:205 (+) Transcript_20367:2132-2746(+)